MATTPAICSCGMPTRYHQVFWMDRDRDRVEHPTRPGELSLDMIAENLTDLPRVDYLGPTPEPGEIVHGEMRASFTYLGAPVYWYGVWVRCEWDETATCDAMRTILQETTS